MASSDEKEFNSLKRFVRLRADFDCNRYKEGPLKRRVAVRMRARGAETYADYLTLLRKDPDELSHLLEALTINVTNFFRNPETYRVLKEKVLRKLVSDKRGEESPRIGVWSAGCSSGEETYSMAILFRELLGVAYGGFRVEIWGTDFDELSIEKAKAGVYSESNLGEMDRSLRQKYFIRDNGYHISPEIKGVCQFLKLDLLAAHNPITALDVILCRNVLIYFSREFQERVFRDFSSRLKRGGYLVLGKVETLVGEAHSLFENIDKTERIYRKVD